MAKGDTLNLKQKQFCLEYIKDLNATQAAIRSGYSPKTAKEIGWENLTKPHIRDFIAKELQARVLTAEETSKLMTDMARSNLNDYFITKKVEHTPRITKGLATIIAELQEEIDFEKEYAEVVQLAEKELESHIYEQEQRKRQIARLKIELKRNPAASRIVDGPTEWIDVVELDLKKLVEDKEHGRIKSLKHTRHGLDVELYAADAVIANLAKIHGLFEKDNAQLKPETHSVFRVEIIPPIE